ncbi:MAG: 4Fe-4S dicluster domain-containing protein [Dehalococcoidia bacterium]|nr:4Fe-4S dicluster domain-containing protein [Dehalococcoidia bacterium]
MAKKIDKKDISGLLSRWQQEFAVLVPSKDGNTTRMALWDGKDTGFLEWYRNVTVPPKEIFFPSQEEMFRFQKDKEGYHLEVPPPEESKRLIFAIRPCDASAMTMLDYVFESDYEDPYYLSRRKNTMLVGLGCTNPYSSCFCTSVGGDPSDASNVDIMLMDLGDAFLVDGVTDAGKELVGRTEGLVEGSKSDLARAAEVKKESQKKIMRKLDTKDIEQKLLSCFEDKDYWEKVSAKCVACGICTLLCPTCHCFDINDEMTKKQGARVRSWDSCAFSCYTKMPMENPREDKWRRVRQKVCHKYEFFPMNFGVIACVGCARCVRFCPVNWDITRTIESVPAAPATAAEK